MALLNYLQLPAYDFIYDLFCIEPDSPILVEKNEKIGYLYRNSGEIRIPFQYRYWSQYSEFCNGYAIVLHDVLPGNDCPNLVLINDEGNEFHFPDHIIPRSFVCNGVVVILQTESIDHSTSIMQYGLATVDGDIILEPSYDYIADFYEGYACAKKNGKWGHINIQGHEIVPPVYELNEEVCGNEGYYFQNGIAELYLSNDSIIYIDYNGNEIDVEF